MGAVTMRVEELELARDGEFAGRTVLTVGEDFALTRREEDFEDVSESVSEVVVSEEAFALAFADLCFPRMSERASGTKAIRLSETFNLVTFLQKIKDRDGSSSRWGRVPRGISTMGLFRYQTV